MNIIENRDASKRLILDYRNFLFILKMIDYKPTYIFILCLIFCCNVYGQLYVSENTEVFLKESTTSQERVNILNSSISGNASIIFNAKIHQVLQSDKENIEIPNLSIHTNSLQIKSSFTVNGNIRIEQANLYLSQPLYLKGQIYFDTESTVSGMKYIHHINIEKHKSPPVSNHYLFKTPFTSTRSAVCESPFEDFILHTKTNPFYTEFLKDSAHLSIPSPPPKGSC